MAYSTYLTLIVPAIFALIATYIAMLFVRSYFLESGVISRNPNKKKDEVIPTSGGVAVSFGFIVGVLVYIFGASFGLYTPVAPVTFLFAAALSVLLITFVGFLDDLNVKTSFGKSTGMKDWRRGMKQWQKPALTFLGALPLMAVNAGVAVVALPFIGAVNFGLIYPLILLPLAVIFVANAFNLLGGFDGMATGTGLIAVLGLLIYSVLYGTYTGALISIVLAASIFVLFLYHRYPVKVLTGDSFTYMFGAAFISAVVIGNMEAFGLIVFLPWILEFIMHARGRFKTTDLGVIKGGGILAAPYGKKIYSWTHIMMNLKPMKEWEVAMYMWFVEIGFVVLAFAMKLFNLL
ncbi:MAG: hypothetical protein LVQ95_03145 [Candidatus Micrarchaeales archaeon]|nr:hypothetical protein [Candidatus Micrarchaeales archaeon]